MGEVRSELSDREPHDAYSYNTIKVVKSSSFRLARSVERVEENETLENFHG
jgi:hypothetical protein